MKDNLGHIADIRALNKDADDLMLDPSVAIKEGNLIRLGIALEDTAIIQYTLDGVNFVSLNSGESQTGGASHLYEFQITAGDTFNLKIQASQAYRIILLKAEVFLES